MLKVLHLCGLNITIQELNQIPSIVVTLCCKINNNKILINVKEKQEKSSPFVFRQLYIKAREEMDFPSIFAV